MNILEVFEQIKAETKARAKILQQIFDELNSRYPDETLLKWTKDTDNITARLLFQNVVFSEIADELMLKTANNDTAPCRSFSYIYVYNELKKYINKRFSKLITA